MDKADINSFIDTFIPVYMLLGMSEEEARKFVIESIIEAELDKE